MDNDDLSLIGLATKLWKLMGHMDNVADQVIPQQIVDVVKLHSKLAVGSAWIPIPGADMAAGAASIWGMYIRINNKIGLSIADNVGKTIASGIATNLASYFAMSTVASALKFIPVIGTIGGALVMSASLYAFTLASGWVYLRALCLLAERSGPSLDMNQLGDAVKDVLKDKNAIKDVIDQAKDNYSK